LDKTFPKLVVKPLVKKMDKSDLVLTESHEYFTKKIKVLEPTLFSVQNILTNQLSPQSVFISEDKLKMHPPNVQEKSTKFDIRYHWGQRKLLLSEILFLTKVLDSKNDDKTVVYVGSAKGTHIKILVKMFPNLKFELYDPNDYDDILYSISNIKIYQQFFTDEDAKKYKNQNVIFISDIRTVPANMKQATEKFTYDFQIEVLKNQDMQKKWVEIINPYYSMLKFKCPYPEVGKPLLYKYIKGEVFKQVWAPVTSAETRLLIKQKDNYTLQDYDIIKHERQLAYFNLARQYDFSNEKVDFIDNITLKDIWKDLALNIKVFNLDFYLELKILNSYFTKFFKIEPELQTYKNNISYITSVLNVNKQTKYPAIEFYFSK
jgi:cap2 methyltransferase